MPAHRHSVREHVFKQMGVILNALFFHSPYKSGVKYCLMKLHMGMLLHHSLFGFGKNTFCWPMSTYMRIFHQWTSVFFHWLKLGVHGKLGKIVAYCALEKPEEPIFRAWWKEWRRCTGCPRFDLIWIQLPSSVRR